MGPGPAAAAPAACALVLAALVLPAGPAGAKATTTTTTHHSAAPKTAQLGHVKFWMCPAKTTQMLVAVNTLTLHPGTPLTISFTIKNGGTSSCNYTAHYASVAPGPTTTTLSAGPCGSIARFEIARSPRQRLRSGPGPQILNCPALGFAQLASNTTVSGTGRGNQTSLLAPSGCRPAATR